MTAIAHVQYFFGKFSQWSRQDAGDGFVEVLLAFITAILYFAAFKAYAGSAKGQKEKDVNLFIACHTRWHFLFTAAGLPFPVWDLLFM